MFRTHGHWMNDPGLVPDGRPIWTWSNPLSGGSDPGSARLPVVDVGRWRANDAGRKSRARHTEAGLRLSTLSTGSQ